MENPKEKKDLSRHKKDLGYEPYGQGINDENGNYLEETEKEAAHPRKITEEDEIFDGDNYGRGEYDDEEEE